MVPRHLPPSHMPPQLRPAVTPRQRPALTPPRTGHFPRRAGCGGAPKPTLGPPPDVRGAEGAAVVRSGTGSAVES